MPETRRVPVSTYRLQLGPGFGFAEAAGIAGYLASLGVTHAYLSPILQAAPGSAHGYDVVDHSAISAELGGEKGFRAMAQRFHHHGLGIIADIVPNHMAVPVPEFLNRPLWSVLRDGPGSSHAHWFDIDWAAQQGRLLLPVLAGPRDECLPEIRLERAGTDAGLPPGTAVLRYLSHVLPVRPGTEDLPLAGLLARQHYRLADWRLAATELNWRRFFDITSLIAIRAEDPEVFTATHRLLLGLVAEGLIVGLRVDHPDGLADPRGYLERLAKASGGAWIVAEKILAGGEELPADWPCAGTTGYDALSAAGGLFLDPAGARPLAREYRRFTGGAGSFAEVARNAKRQTAAHGLAAEVSRLARVAARAGAPALAGHSEQDLAGVLTELLAAFPVYRAYVVPGEPAPPAAVATIDAAAAAARERLPARLHAALAAVRDLALGRGAAADIASRDEFIVRFGQTCGPVMAKGVEDTAFYRWSRLVTLNEVGGDPGTFGTSPARFHAFAARLARDWPATMTALSTHDTKRQEDVRARLAVLSEAPGEWAATVAQWHDRAAALAHGRLPEPDTEYLLWQTLAGAWPAGGQRIRDYLRKAMREAKTATSWTEPDLRYENKVLGFAEVLLNDPVLAAAIARLVTSLVPDAWVNSLGAKLVQLTMPGVADAYQGCELAGLSLADPDNRRPVDWARRRRLLAGLGAGTSPAGAGAPGLGAGKLLVTARALRLRRGHPDWFAGSYTPLRARGPAARHVVAFLRGGHAVTVATRLPRGLRRAGGWGPTVLPLPPGRWRDVLTGTAHEGPPFPLSRLAQRLPVALLIPDAASVTAVDMPGMGA